MTQVMKVSKATYDVLTTGNGNLIFSSELATHSFFSVTTAHQNANVQQTTITHNLGYTPKVWIFRKNGSGTQRLPIKFTTGSGRLDYKITTTNIIISNDGSGYAYYSNAQDYYVIIFTRAFTP